METAISSLAQLKRAAQRYTWELYYNSLAPQMNDPHNIPEHMRGHRTVTKAQSNGIWLRLLDGQDSFLKWPEEKEVSFHHYTPGGSIPSEISPFKNHVIVKIIYDDDAHLMYHLRPLE